MKKITYMAAAAIMGAAITVTPIQAMAARPVQGNVSGGNRAGIVKILSAGEIPTVNAESLKDLLGNCQPGKIQIITIPCLPGNNPGTEDNDQSNNSGSEDVTQSVHAYVKRIVELVNEERAKAGLKALTLKADITEAAQVRAVECETSFSHTRPNGTSFVTALKEAGVSYRGAGENIAWGQKTPEQVMEAWMNSSGHRANILNEKYTSIGVGFYQNAAGRNYWSQLFTY